MRIRCKPWAKPELDACPFCVKEPDLLKGRWQDVFPKKQPLYIELGCGKGGFISQIAPEYPEINFIALDIKNEMLVLAKRKLEEAYARKGLSPDNVRIAIKNISLIEESFGEEDKADRIYINFCNPWPRRKHKKRRLTHTRRLIQYRRFLKDEGEIWFKTDDDELFYESIPYFYEAGFDVIFRTYDLAEETKSGCAVFGDRRLINFCTEHERMFTEEGKKIKMLIARPLDRE
jgi:tRNA (guanine-N7-)-methyltransferase